MSAPELLTQHVTQVFAVHLLSTVWVLGNIMSAPELLTQHVTQVFAIHLLSTAKFVAAYDVDNVRHFPLVLSAPHWVHEARNWVRQDGDEAKPEDGALKTMLRMRGDVHVTYLTKCKCHQQD
eukprot:CAMPEP_0178394448 /NCGR_PEP_ID=MMETSP0689_2-20121128/12711_1 /TAXON_ID=160604 /ORGANISM="Amphidinium massartii, Strain CS-259" /LENGTH=121 /DNA_ID=CAMNT_0020015077 /DNA_START=75 /DNA_END=440 /DNA_ORIENTATION=-